jgi:glycosyltransferase involved in cell wall biosynthesis
VIGDGGATYSVIVPVRNEASVLGRTVPLLLTATEGDDAEIVYVCNGCTDSSAAMIRNIAGSRVRLIETRRPGKTAALNLGDRATSLFPRFYIDADVVVEPGCLAKLADILARGEADLVSPALDFEDFGSTRIARAIGRIWLSLPHGAEATFQAVIGLSQHARSRWGEFPDILGDDVFIQANVAPLPRRLVTELRAVTPFPRSFLSWIMVRARWLEGERQLARRGLTVPRAPHQRKRLLSLFLAPRTSLAAAAFMLARCLAWPVSLINAGKRSSWPTDRPVR